MQLWIIHSVTGTCESCHLSDKINWSYSTLPIRAEIVTIRVVGQRLQLWITASVNGTCESCHLSDKTMDHIVSANTCGDCHDPSGWLNAVMDHTSVTGTCESCHLSDKTTGHIVSANTCGDCHDPSGWTEIAVMDHCISERHL